MKSMSVPFREHPTRLLAFLWLVIGGVWAFASLRRHWAYQSHAFDLGLFTNAIWNLTHGNGYVSSVKGGMNLFADHQSPIFWAFAPLFALAPFPETLLIVQALILAAGAPSLYFLFRQFTSGRKDVPAWLAFALPLLYWLYLPIRKANAFDFHPEVAMLPLFLWGVVGLQAGRVSSRAWGAASFVLAVLCKESAGPVAAGLGLAWILGVAPDSARSRMRKVGIGAVAFGAVAFAIALKVPGWLGQSYAYQNAYAQFGPGFSDLLLSPIQKPLLLLEQLTGPARRKFLLATLGPLAFLPFFAPRAAVAALPGYLMMFLTAGDQRVNLTFHYSIEPATGLFFALAPGALRAWGYLKKLFQNPERAMAIVLIGFTLLTAQRSEFYRATMNFRPTAHARALTDQVLPALDPALPFAASEALVPHLAARPWAEPLDAPWEGRVECVVLDREVSNWPLSSQDLDRVAARAAQAGMAELANLDGIRIFGRNPQCVRF